MGPAPLTDAASSKHWHAQPLCITARTLYPCAGRAYLLAGPCVGDGNLAHFARSFHQLQASFCTTFMTLKALNISPATQITASITIVIPIICRGALIQLMLRTPSATKVELKFAHPIAGHDSMCAAAIVVCAASSHAGQDSTWSGSADSGATPCCAGPEYDRMVWHEALCRARPKACLQLTPWGDLQ